MQKRKIPDRCTESIEKWMLTTLRIMADNLESDDFKKEMSQVSVGSLMTIESLLHNVAIRSDHDEIAAAYKKCVLLLPEGDGKAFLQYLGLWVFRKLDAEKKGEVVDWDAFGCARTFDDGPFVAKEIKAAWAE